MKRGEPRLDFKVAAEAVAATGIANPRLLEVGCGSGYYSEVFATLLPGGVQLHRHRLFRCHDRPRPRALSVSRIRGRRRDQTALRRRRVRYRLQRRIAACTSSTIRRRSARPRVSRRATASFTPCRCSTITARRSCRKYAYGAPVVEIVFGKQELIALCRDAGLRFEREWPGIPYDVHEVTGHHSVTETYLFAKAGA